MALLDFATLVGLQGFATQVNVLKLPLVPHVAIPPPEYPTSHVTVTVCPVVPFILLAAALLELVTCVEVQA